MTILTMDDFKFWKFPNGEWRVTAPTCLHPDNHEPIYLNFKWPDPLNTDIMLPIMMVDALDKLYSRDIVLRMSYLPYLRQDRAFEFGNTVAAETVIDILRMYCNQIQVLSPHSSTSEITKVSFQPEYDTFNPDGKEFYAVKPDENAYTSWMGRDELIFKKTRNDDGVQLTLLSKNIDISLSHRAVIFDDLCDGGATFIECAKQLKQLGFTEVWLCIAHGFFTKGIDHLFNNGIDKIVTTDSVCRLQPSDKLIIFDALKELSNA